MIDITKLREYKWCSRGILVAVFRYGSRWLRSEYRESEKSSAQDGVLKPPPLLAGSIGVDRVLSRVWRTPMCRWTAMLLGSVGALAFLLSAVVPDDDALQQEFFHSRVSARVVSRHAREAAGNAVSVHLSTVYWPAAKLLVVPICEIDYPLHTTALRICGRIPSTIRASRAPPASV